MVQISIPYAYGHTICVYAYGICTICVQYEIRVYGTQQNQGFGFLLYLAKWKVSVNLSQWSCGKMCKWY